MKTKVDIEIVTGFIGSGKTFFINTLIKNTFLFMEKVLIIQNEQGIAQIEDSIINSKNISLEQYDPQLKLNSEYINSMIDKYKPHRIIIEYNGTKNLIELTDIISQELTNTCKISSVFYISDINTYSMFLSNMPGLILPCIHHSNLIILNNCANISKDKLKEIKSNINRLNRDTFIATIDKMDSLEKELQYMAILDGGFLKLLRISLRILLSKI
ncbi:cobalamin biosynthesis protein [Clostridium sp. YIM B02505]|uniref:Cobalamin biosynthesis protein n=1 Tax=Clostridium yunnanense TaxID=2800325 RepID=A0ABS1ENU0_9CLOT|nr:GTP-binding protein [Clostridium yunnanense]MBK1810943.1 cobalamin biosynthesis protein [Clostridium yunnanense]